MKKTFLVLAIIAISTFVAAAQTAASDYTKGEFFAGYSNAFNVDDEGPLYIIGHGVNLAGVYNVHRYIGIKADVSATTGKTTTWRFTPGFDNPTRAEVSYKQKFSTNNFTVGVQFKDNAEKTRFKPFAHVLVGVGQNKSKVTDVSCTTITNCQNVPPTETSTGFALVIGGGLDIKVSRRIDIRAVQLDLNAISPGRDATLFRGGTANFRFSTGVVFKF